MVDDGDGIDPAILSIISRLSIMKRTDSPMYVEDFPFSCFTGIEKNNCRNLLGIF